MKKRYFILFMLLLVFGFVRVYEIDIEGFSPAEEAFNYILANSSLQTIVERCIDSNQLPLPILIRKSFHHFFKITTESSRIFTAITGVLSLIPVYLLGNYLYGHYTGLIAMIFTGFSASHILHSRIIREYPLFMLLITLAIFFFFKILRNQGKNYFIYLNIILIMAFYTHFATPALVLSFLVIFYINNRSLKIFIKKISPSLLLFLPWVAGIIYAKGDIVYHLYSSTGSFFVKSYGFSGLSVPLYLFSTRDRLDNFQDIHIIVLSMLLLLLFPHFLKLNFREKKKEDSLVILFFLPLLCGMIIFNILGRDDLLKLRYFLPFIAPLAILMSDSFLRIRIKTFQILFLIIFVFSSLFCYSMEITTDEEARVSEPCCRWIIENYNKGDMVIIEPPLTADYFIAHPENFKVHTLRQKELFGAFTSQTIFSKISSKEEIENEIEKHERIIYYFYPYFEEDKHINELRLFIEKNFRLSKSLKLESSVVTIYSKK